MGRSGDRTSIRSAGSRARRRRERLPKLKLISQSSVYPHIDLDTCTRRGILLCSDMHPGEPSYATAELAWGMIISAYRHIPQEVAALKAGRWQTTIGTVLRGKTLGVVGYGRIGGQLARYAKAFDMKVLAWGRAKSAERAKADGVEVVASKEELFERSDVVTLHVRLTPETRGLVTAADLARMKPTAMIVNTRRHHRCAGDRAHPDPSGPLRARPTTLAGTGAGPASRGLTSAQPIPFERTDAPPRCRLCLGLASAARGTLGPALAGRLTRAPDSGRPQTGRSSPRQARRRAAGPVAAPLCGFQAGQKRGLNFLARPLAATKYLTQLLCQTQRTHGERIYPSPGVPNLFPIPDVRTGW